MRILGKLTWLELKLFAREPLTVIFTLALPVIPLFILGGVFGNTPDPEGVVYRGVGPMDFYVPAHLSLVIASLGLIGLPVHLAAYRERGVLRRFRASSVGLRNILGSQVAVLFIMAIMGGVILVAVATAAYDINAPRSSALAVPAFLLSVLCFGSIGVMLGSILPTARAAQGVGVLLWFVMIFISGAGPPPEVLTEAMRWAAKLMPLTHTVRLLQDPWVGFGWNNTETLVVAGIVIATALISLRFFRWEAHRR